MGCWGLGVAKLGARRRKRVRLNRSNGEIEEGFCNEEWRKTTTKVEVASGKQWWAVGHGTLIEEDDEMRKKERVLWEIFWNGKKKKKKEWEGSTKREREKKIIKILKYKTTVTV